MQSPCLHTIPELPHKVCQGLSVGVPRLQQLLSVSLACSHVLTHLPPGNTYPPAAAPAALLFFPPGPCSAWKQHPAVTTATHRYCCCCYSRHCCHHCCHQAATATHQCCCRHCCHQAAAAAVSSLCLRAGWARGAWRCPQAEQHCTAAAAGQQQQQQGEGRKVSKGGHIVSQSKWLRSECEGAGNAKGMMTSTPPPQQHHVLPKYPPPPPSLPSHTVNAPQQQWLP